MVKMGTRGLLLCLVLLFAVNTVFAQVDTVIVTPSPKAVMPAADSGAMHKTDTITPLKIAVLAPIYLDSVFYDNDYTGGNIVPAYVLPGLEFYNGVMMAVDSLQKENIPVELWVYDTKKKFETTEMLKADLSINNFSLIIACVSSAMEQKELGEFAFNHNIPFISGTYPNDAGLSGNPFYAIVNPTIKSHTQAIYNYVQRNYLGNKVYYVTKQGNMEQRIKGYFDGMKANNYALKYTPINLPAVFKSADILPFIDSTTDGVIVCGSLDEGFGASLIKTINNSGVAKTVTIVGMPTWDNMGILYNEDSKNVSVVYSTPYNYNRKNALLASLSNQYRARFNGRPSDMVFKGFEQVYHFTHLLAKYGDSLFSHLSDTAFTVANNYNFQPVRLTASSYAPDFLENKKLYFIKMQGGSVKN